MKLDALQTMIMVITFGLLLALWGMAVIIWMMRRIKRGEAIKGRIGLELSPAHHEHELNLWFNGKRVSTKVANAASYSIAQRMAVFYRRTGWRTPGHLLLVQIVLLMLLAGLLALYFAHSAIIAALAAAVIPWLIWVLARMRIERRRVLFDQQFVDALELGARSLRAGHPLGGAIQLIAGEIPDPVGSVFADVCQQQNLGVGLNDALIHTARTINDPNLNMLAAAIAIHFQSGGSLASMMERLAMVVRDRTRLDRRVHVLTAQTQFSKRILLMLPVVAFVGLNILNPQYMQPLYHTTTGHWLIFACIIGLIIGSMIINRLAKVGY